jgi:hypothetical protein
MKTKSRSPIKDKPLRLPGQSVEEEREKLLDDAVGEPLLLALFMVVLAALEWYRLYTGMKPNPIIFSAAAVLLVFYAAYRIIRALPRLRNLRLALEGEKAVGQYLEGLRAGGFHVFHDVIGDGFNVDHVLVGPAGVFTVETKTWSKPMTGSPQILFDGETIKKGDLSPDRDPIIQAKAQANWLRSLLQESTGRRFDVRPVVVFPGWFVKGPSGGYKDVWVLEPKALPSFLDHEPNRLELEDVKLASFHLSRLIRSGEKTR